MVEAHLEQQHRDRRGRWCRSGAYWLVSGDQFAGLGPVLLFAIIFFWTPPHFWALAIRYEEDYTAANVPMLPSVVSRHETAVRILIYTLIVWALTIAFIPVGDMGWIYGVLAARTGWVFHLFVGAITARSDHSTGDAPLHLFHHMGDIAVRRNGPRPTGSVGSLSSGLGRFDLGSEDSDRWFSMRHRGVCRVTTVPPLIRRVPLRSRPAPAGPSVHARTRSLQNMALTDTRPETGTDASAVAPSVVPSPLTIFGTGDHKAVGTFYVLAALVFGIAGWVAAALSLGHEVGSNSFLSGSAAMQLGQTSNLGLILLVIVPLFLGLGTYIVPLQVGASTVAFPRAAAAAMWTWLLSSGVFIVASFIDGGFGGSRDKSVSLTLMALAGLIVALLLGTVCVLTTAVTLRTPGMTLDRVPMFTFSILVGGAIWLLTLPVLLANLLLIWVDHRYNGGTTFGAGAIQFEQVSWITHEPQIYAFLIPGLGVVADVIATLTGAPGSAQHSPARHWCLRGSQRWCLGAARHLPRSLGRSPMAGHGDSHAVSRAVAFWRGCQSLQRRKAFAEEPARPRCRVAALHLVGCACWCIACDHPA